MQHARVDEWVPKLTGLPIPHRPRVLTPVQTTILDEQVRQWLVKGVIEPRPLDAYHNNLVFVAKKSGAIRVCIDPTPTNLVTEGFDWPLPSLQDLRHHLSGAQYFSRLDLADAFFRILVPAPYRLWTSFRARGQHYQFRRMPFGLKTAPSIFQRFMDQHLATLGIGYFWYIDDILVYAADLSILRMRVTRLKEKLRAMGSTINEAKSEYDKTSLLFLGMTISAGQLGPNPDKVRGILATPAPRNKAQAQSALGLVSYLRDFIPLSSHFTSLLYPDKGGLRLEPTVYAAEWQKLMGHVASAATSLRHWKKGIPGDLYADASNFAIGLVLMQEGRIVSLASRKLTSAELNYSATDREHIALVYAAKRFRIFLHQSDCETRVWSDHAALMTRRTEDLTPKQARWQSIVKYWMPNVKHVKGCENPADFFSRWSTETTGGAIFV